jgi:hypothetical protein
MVASLGLGGISSRENKKAPNYVRQQSILPDTA